MVPTVNSVYIVTLDLLVYLRFRSLEFCAPLCPAISQTGWARVVPCLMVSAPLKTLNLGHIPVRTFSRPDNFPPCQLLKRKFEKWDKPILMNITDLSLFFVHVNGRLLYIVTADTECVHRVERKGNGPGGECLGEYVRG